MGDGSWTRRTDGCTAPAPSTRAGSPTTGRWPWRRWSGTGRRSGAPLAGRVPAARLDELPRGLRPIEDWREALATRSGPGTGWPTSTGELREQPWREVLGTWWPRLLPGIAAGATHGVIRVGHAVRALRTPAGPGEAAESPARLAELGQALAYWAARWQPVPAPPDPGVRTGRPGSRRVGRGRRCPRRRPRPAGRMAPVDRGRLGRTRPADPGHLADTWRRTSPPRWPGCPASPTGPGASGNDWASCRPYRGGRPRSRRCGRRGTPAEAERGSSRWCTAPASTTCASGTPSRSCWCTR